MSAGAAITPVNNTHLLSVLASYGDDYLVKICNANGDEYGSIDVAELRSLIRQKLNQVIYELNAGDTTISIPQSNIDDYDVILIKINSTSGTAQLDLPAAPNNGDHITFKDVLEQAGTRNVVIDPNGKTIDGEANYTIDTDDATLDLVYNANSGDWEILSTSSIDPNSHVQNTDQYLDFGGSNQMFVGEVKLGYLSYLMKMNLSFEFDNLFIDNTTPGAFDISWDQLDIYNTHDATKAYVGKVTVGAKSFSNVNNTNGTETDGLYFDYDTIDVAIGNQTGEKSDVTLLQLCFVTDDGNLRSIFPDIQAAIDKVVSPRLISDNVIAGTSHTVSKNNRNRINNTTNASPVVITVPTHASEPFNINDESFWQQDGAGQPQFVFDAGATVYGETNLSGEYKIAAQGGMVGLKNCGPDIWRIYGRLELT